MKIMAFNEVCERIAREAIEAARQASDMTCYLPSSHSLFVDPKACMDVMTLSIPLALYEDICWSMDKGISWE